LEPVGELLEDVIAQIVAESIVEFFEAIKISWKRRAIPAQQTILGRSALRYGKGAALSQILDDALSVFWYDVVDDTHSNQCVGIATCKHLRDPSIAHHEGAGGVISRIMRHCFFSVMWHVRSSCRLYGYQVAVLDRGSVDDYRRPGAIVEKYARTECIVSGNNPRPVILY